MINEVRRTIKNQIRSLAEKRVFVNTATYDSKIKSSEIDEIYPREFISFNILPKFMAALEKIKEKLVRQENELIFNPYIPDIFRDEIKNIKYLGFLERKKLLDLETNSDAMIALYDLNLQSQYEYGMANKILEAMMCGLPVITNISHELINDTKCGMIVEYDNIEQIKESIVTLRDNPDLRRLYGTNGRKAFLEKYNWAKMEEKLFRMYEVLLNHKIDLDK